MKTLLDKLDDAFFANEPFQLVLATGEVLPCRHLKGIRGRADAPVVAVMDQLGKIYAFRFGEIADIRMG